MSRRYRSFSKSSMLKALSALNLERATRDSAERRRWRPRMLLAFLCGLATSWALTAVVHYVQ